MTELERNVISAAKRLFASDHDLSVICYGRLPMSRDELKKVYPKFRSAFEELRAALSALAPGKGGDVKTIQLTQGKEAIVDDCDYEEIAKFKWCAKREGLNYYARRTAWIGKGKRRPVIYMHRAVLGIVTGQLDHVNGNGLDNRRSNLRRCSQLQNNRNSVKRSKASSTYKGVYWHRNRWIARLTVQGERIHLGSFTDELKAAKAYDVAARRVFGEFARLNLALLDAEHAEEPQ